MLTKDDAKDRLKEWFPRGSTVYCVLRHVAKSGMSRRISLIGIQGKSHDPSDVRLIQADYCAGILLGISSNRHNKPGLAVSGCGMDMGLHLVSSLSSALYGDARELRHEWI